VPAMVVLPLPAELLAPPAAAPPLPPLGGGGPQLQANANALTAANA